ncbi:MAG TPA: hypothetical protein VFS60_00955 [Thermoanaerobaculia bacterium]|nr:hypothetical protein [Thermoanaerobaculia bacterium]
MRIAAAAIAAALLATACGDTEPRSNLPRPPAPVTITAAVHDDLIQVSPAITGAGPIVLLVSNQTSKPQKVTFETDELGGRTGGNTVSTPVIAPQSTGRLSINARSGRYAVHVQDRTIRAARVSVGPPRKSSQNQLLLP